LFFPFPTLLSLFFLSASAPYPDPPILILLAVEGESFAPGCFNDVVLWCPPPLAKYQFCCPLVLNLALTIGPPFCLDFFFLILFHWIWSFSSADLRGGLVIGVPGDVRSWLRFFFFSNLSFLSCAVTPP